MNILDTFFFMFEADASNVEKGAKKGEEAAKEMKKAIDSADFSADKLAANFIKMARNGAAALGSVLALGAIKSLVNDTAAHTAAVALQARAMDMNVEKLNAYQHAIRAVGGSEQDAAATLESLRNKFVEMSRFGVMAGPDSFMFRQLGLSAKQMQESIKDPTIALGALADKFQTLNHTQQLYIGKKLGLDQGTIALLGEGRRAFDEMLAKQKELGVVTQAQADAAMKYKIAQAELGMSFETVKREIVTQLLPAFTAVVKGIDTMVQWAREHKGFLIGFFGAMAVVVGVTLLPVLVSAAAAMWALIAPALLAAAPFIALAAAIGLVVDDFEKYKAGQNSVIGEIFKKWPAAKEIVVGALHTMKAELMTLLTVLQSVWDYFAALLEFFANVITKGPTKALDILHDKVGAIADKLKNAFSGLWSGLKEYGKGVVDAVTGEKPDEKKQDADVKTPQAAGDDTKKPDPTPPASVPGETPADVPRAPVSATPPVAAGDAAVTMGKSANGRQIAQKLVESGKWTPEQAAGIAGSFMQESQGKADARNKTSGAYGLGQWLGSRRRDFEQWSGKPLEGSSLDDQIQFFNYETSHKEKRAGDKIRAAKTAAEAAVAHSKYYERPGAAEANNARREQYANMIYQGQQQIAATNTPLATQTSQSIANTYGGNRSTQVTIGDTTIHTQATDPKDIANQFNDHVAKHYNDALDQHDNGVLI
jgi:hypothetical protein